MRSDFLTRSRHAWRHAIGRMDLARPPAGPDAGPIAQAAVGQRARALVIPQAATSHCTRIITDKSIMKNFATHGDIARDKKCDAPVIRVYLCLSVARLLSP